MDSKLVEAFGERVRVRACGICVVDHQVLLVGHRGLLADQLYWSPPGGGISFGERSSEAVSREFFEETGLSVKVGSFMFFQEFVAKPLHAVELYFQTVAEQHDTLFCGMDPELPHEKQTISEVRFMTMKEIHTLPPHCVDPVFRKIPSLAYLCEEQNWPTIQKQLI